MTWYKWRPNIPHPYSCICQCGDLPTIEKRCKIIWGQSWSEVAVSTPGSSRSGWVTWCWLFLFFENKKHFDILSPTTDENKSNWSPARKIVQIGKVVQINKRVSMYGMCDSDIQNIWILTDATKCLHCAEILHLWSMKGSWSIYRDIHMHGSRVDQRIVSDSVASRSNSFCSLVFVACWGGGGCLQLRWNLNAMTMFQWLTIHMHRKWSFTNQGK